MKDSKIAVVGAGAIGLYYGGLLAASGYDVHFLLRSDYAAVRSGGIRIRSGEVEVQVKDVHAHESSKSIGPCDYVFIGLKTTSNEVLRHLLPPLLGPGTRLLTLQNGLGNEAWLASHFPHHPVYGALCFVCLNRTAPGEVEHFGHGTVSLGAHEDADPADGQQLRDAFLAAGVETHYVDNLALERWKKLVWNVPFNGLAIAANNATVDIVLQSPQLRQEAEALMLEVIQGAAAQGLHIDRSYADFQMQRSESMGAYKASSLIDHLAGKPVEVESIWGEPLRQAQSKGCALPRLALLYALLSRICMK